MMLVGDDVPLAEAGGRRQFSGDSIANHGP